MAYICDFAYINQAGKYFGKGIVRNNITDEEGRKSVVFYQVNLKLINIHRSKKPLKNLIQT